MFFASSVKTISKISLGFLKLPLIVDVVISYVMPRLNFRSRFCVSMNFSSARTRDSRELTSNGGGDDTGGGGDTEGGDDTGGGW